MIFLKLSDQTATHNETSDTVVTQQPSIDMKLILESWWTIWPKPTVSPITCANWPTLSKHDKIIPNQHTHTQFCKHLMTHRGLQILPFVCNQMYVNSIMRAFLKNMSHLAFGPKGDGAGRAKNRRRDLGYGILFLPSLIRLGLQSWTTVWNQPLLGIYVGLFRVKRLCLTIQNG